MSKKQKHEEAAQQFLGQVFAHPNGYAGTIYEVKVDDVQQTLSFSVPTSGVPVNYETLNKVAEHYGTKNISFEGGTIGHGYCETCGWDEDVVKINVRGITQNLLA